MKGHRNRGAHEIIVLSELNGRARGIAWSSISLKWNLIEHTLINTFSNEIFIAHIVFIPLDSDIKIAAMKVEFLETEILNICINYVVIIAVE